MYHKVEDQLHRNFDSIAPDLFTQIKDADIHRIESEDILFSELPNLESKKKESKCFSFSLRYAAIAACLVFFLLISTIYAISMNRTAGKVTVEMESTVCMSLNRSNKIIHVEIDKKDKSGIDESKLKGMDLEEALDYILDTQRQQASHKKITIRYDSENKQESTRKKIEEVSKEYSDLDINAQCQNYAKNSMISDRRSSAPSTSKMSDGKESMKASDSPVISSQEEKECDTKEGLAEDTADAASNSEEVALIAGSDQPSMDPKEDTEDSTTTALLQKESVKEDTEEADIGEEASGEEASSDADEDFYEATEEHKIDTISSYEEVVEESKSDTTSDCEEMTQEQKIGNGSDHTTSIEEN